MILEYISTFLLIFIGISHLLSGILSIIGFHEQSKCKYSLNVNYILFSSIKNKTNDKMLVPFYGFGYDLKIEDKVKLVSKIDQMAVKITKYIKTIKIHNNLPSFIGSYGWKKLYPYGFSSYGECKTYYEGILVPEVKSMTEDIKILELTFY